jgi:hypothetical protein
VEIDPVEGAKVHRTTTLVEDLNPTTKSYLYEISDVPDVEPRAMPWITNSYLDPWLARLRALRPR